MKHLIIPLLSLITSCAAPEANVEREDTPGVDTIVLAGSEWSPVNPFEAAPDVFIQFGGEDRLSGSAGCNSMTGTYVQDGSKLTIGQLATTRKLCPSDAMEVERMITNALRQTASAEVSHLELRLLDTSGKILLDMRRDDWD